MRLSGMMALVTGASSGIGAATAASLAAAGARLLLAGRDHARLADVAARTGGQAVAGDLATPGGAATLAEAARGAAPDGIDILVSNAGVGCPVPWPTSAPRRSPNWSPSTSPRRSSSPGC